MRSTTGAPSVSNRIQEAGYIYILSIYIYIYIRDRYFDMAEKLV